MPNWQTMTGLLAGIPDLPGARCKGRADLFEQTVAEYRFTGGPTKTKLDTARTAALRICTTCPALNPCRAWLDQEKVTRRPRGVVAGQVIAASGQPMKSARVHL